MCWNCDEHGHIAADCKAPTKEGKVRPGGKRDKSQAQQVQSSKMTSDPERTPTTDAGPASVTPEDPRQFLLPDSDGGESEAQVEEVRVSDRGSRPQMVRVIVAGVPVQGVVDTAADISI